MACGSSSSFGTSGTPDALIMKIAEDGAVQWSKVIGDSTNSAFCHEVVLSRDKTALYFTGESSGFGSIQGNLIYGKMDLDGSLLWLKTTGETEQLGGSSLI